MLSFGSKHLVGSHYRPHSLGWSCSGITIPDPGRGEDGVRCRRLVGSYCLLLVHGRARHSAIWCANRPRCEDWSTHVFEALSDGLRAKSPTDPLVMGLRKVRYPNPSNLPR